MRCVGTTGGISGEDVRDRMVAAIERSFGRVSRLPFLRRQQQRLDFRRRAASGSLEMNDRPETKPWTRMPPL